MYVDCSSTNNLGYPIKNEPLGLPNLDNRTQIRIFLCPTASRSPHNADVTISINEASDVSRLCVSDLRH